MSQQRNLALWLLASLSFLFLMVLLSAEVEAQETINGPRPIHLNLKANGLLSPQGVAFNDQSPVQVRESTHWSNDEDESRYKGNWTSFGTWTAKPVRYDITLKELKVNLWWVEDPSDKNFDARMELNWTIYIDGAKVHNLSEGTNDSDQDGYADGIGICDQTMEKPCQHLTNLSLPALTLLKGQRLGIEIEMRSFQTIVIFFDAFGTESGISLTTNATYFFPGQLTRTSLSFELVQAWPVNQTIALNNQFIELEIDDAVIENKFQPGNYPRVQKGVDHLIENTTVPSSHITWSVTGQDQVIRFSYTDHRSEYAYLKTISVPALLGELEEEKDDEPRKFFGLNWWILLLLIILFVIFFLVLNRMDRDHREF